MILFGHERAVKISVDEPGRPALMRQIDAAATVATVRIAYAEARAAFARKRRERGLDARSLRRVVESLDQDWPTFGVVEVNEPLVRRAGSLAERHDLRGYDAIHLAAAVVLERRRRSLIDASTSTCGERRLRELRAPAMTC